MSSFPYVALRSRQPSSTGRLHSCSWREEAKDREKVLAPKDGERRISSLRELKELIREDRSVNFGWGRPGFQALAVHRIGVYKDSIRGRLARLPFALFYWLGYGFVRNFYGIELPAKTRIGRRVNIGHQHGIVVHPRTIIGDDCILRQGVTIGQTTHEPGPAPKLGQRVEVGAGAVLFGNIIIGDGVRIGPNSVVMTNVPAGAIVSAPAARIMALPRRQVAATSEEAGTAVSPSTAVE